MKNCEKHPLFEGFPKCFRLHIRGSKNAEGAPIVQSNCFQVTTDRIQPKVEETSVVFWCSLLEVCDHWDIWARAAKDMVKKIRPHRRCKGRDHPDGISQLRFRFTWGGGYFFEKTSCF